MAKDDPHFRLRIPAELKAEIEAAASAQNRSINAEIVARLEESFSKESEQARMLGQQMAATVDLSAKIAELNGHLAVFGRAFDDAARGDMEAVERFISFAKQDPRIKARAKKKGAIIKKD